MSESMRVEWGALAYAREYARAASTGATEMASASSEAHRAYRVALAVCARGHGCDDDPAAVGALLDAWAMASRTAALSRAAAELRDDAFACVATLMFSTGAGDVQSVDLDILVRIPTGLRSCASRAPPTPGFTPLRLRGGGDDADAAAPPPPPLNTVSPGAAVAELVLNDPAHSPTTPSPRRPDSPPAQRCADRASDPAPRTRGVRPRAARRSARLGPMTADGAGCT